MESGRRFLAFFCVIFVAGIQTQEVYSAAATYNSSSSTATSSSPSVNITTRSKRLNCRRPSSMKERSVCCTSRIKRFSGNWYNGGSYLQTFFEELQVLKCPELIDVCEEKLYAKFSEYSSLVYASYCDIKKFQSECKAVVADARGVDRNLTWEKVVSNMSSTEIRKPDLQKPCLQVALYRSKSGGYRYYHEVVDPFIPFCDISWCGFDAKTIEDREISSWDCMPSWCRTNLTIAVVVCGLLAGAIVLANVTVIVVFTTSPKLRNSQAVYKISLAIADLLVGAFVLPTFISSLTILYQSRASMGFAVRGRKNGEGTVARRPGGLFEQRFSNEYINFVGFFTILPLIISIYTLMMASFDRFMAIHKPLKYSQHRAKRMALWTSLGLWIAAIFYSVLPIFVPGMKYGLVASVMMAALDTTALISYAVFMLIPLLLMWVLTISTYLSTKQHAKVRQAMRVRRGSQGNTYARMEARLAKTLATMVGAFTACLLPAAIILIVPHGLSNIYQEQPKKFNPRASKAFIAMEFVAILILMTNSLWNCFIYNSRSDEFKKTAKHLYVRILRALGFNVLWRKTRDFATTTVRSKSSLITTVMTTRRLRKMSNDLNLNTNTNAVPNAYRHSQDYLESNAGVV